jgi:hypothetical protein
MQQTKQKPFSRPLSLTILDQTGLTVYSLIEFLAGRIAELTSSGSDVDVIMVASRLLTARFILSFLPTLHDCYDQRSYVFAIHGYIALPHSSLRPAITLDVIAQTASGTIVIAGLSP